MTTSTPLNLCKRLSMKAAFCIIILTFCISPKNINAQSVGINDTGTSPDPSAMLDVQSTSKGILIPRMTTIQRATIASPTDGLLVFDIQTQSFWYYSNTSWVDLSSSKLLSDIDADTKIEVEKSMDEDSIRFTVKGHEIALLDDKTFHLDAPGYSVFIGKDSGASDDGTNNYNVGVGYETLKNDAGGWSNTAVGYQALSLNDAGDNNTAIGVNSMYKTHYGDFNVALGNATLYENTSGAGNVAIGYQTLRSNLGAQRNVAVGHNAMYSNSSGETNVAIGSRALYNNNTVDDLVAIGDSALFNNGVGAFGFNGTSNVAVGSRSLKNNTTGHHNTAVGITSMEENINGIHNAAFGDRSMEKNQNGLHNAAFGTHSLHLNIDGNFNTGHGSYTLFNNVSGNHNTAIGTRALFYNTVQSSSVAIGDSSLFNNGLGGAGINNGIKNTAIGKSSGISNRNGSKNVYVGHRAGGENVTGSGNVFLGNEAGGNELGSNNLYIDNSNTAIPLLYGEFDNDLVRINGELNINNEYSFPTTDGGADEVITTDGSGQLTWETKSDLGLFELDGNTIRQKTGYKQNFLVGRDALPVNNIGVIDTLMFFDNSKAAFRAGQLRVSSRNWAPDSIGFASVAFGENTKAKGDKSMAFGSYTEALGSKSTAWGSQSIASGSESTAWGYQSLATGLRSTAWGINTEAEGSYSTTCGGNVNAYSGYETVFGRYNTAYSPDNPFAWDSDDRLFVIANGTSDALRSNALTIMKNGNFGIGTDDPSVAFDIRANTVFNNAGANLDFRIESDNQSYMFFVDGGTNRVGIGESSPEGFLHVDSDNSAPALVLQGGTSGDLTWSSAQDLNLGTWNFSTNTYDELMQIENTGEVGINEPNPNGMLHIKQKVGEKILRLENDNNSNHWSYDIGLSFLSMYYNDSEVGFWSSATGNYTATSDRRAKKDITYLTSPILDKVLNLKPASYRLNFADANSQKAIGFIAQDVEEFLPEVVRHKEESDGLAINYDDFGVLAIKAIQEQQLLIDSQQELIEGLLKRIEALEDK